MCHCMCVSWNVSSFLNYLSNTNVIFGHKLIIIDVRLDRFLLLSVLVANFKLFTSRVCLRNEIDVASAQTITVKTFSINIARTGFFFIFRGKVLIESFMFCCLIGVGLQVTFTLTIILTILRVSEKVCLKFWWSAGHFSGFWKLF